MFRSLALTDKRTQSSCKYFAVHTIPLETSPSVIGGIAKYVLNELSVPRILHRMLLLITLILILFCPQNADSVNIKFPAREEILFYHL